MRIAIVYTHHTTLSVCRVFLFAILIFETYAYVRLSVVLVWVLSVFFFGHWVRIYLCACAKCIKLGGRGQQPTVQMRDREMMCVCLVE